MFTQFLYGRVRWRVVGDLVLSFITFIENVSSRHLQIALTNSFGF
jgi:hypothetical protein